MRNLRKVHNYNEKHGMKKRTFQFQEKRQKDQN